MSSPNPSALPRFLSTYFDPDAPCRWLRGNHHGHSTVSDGQLTPLENVRVYEAAVYHWLALSEHDKLFSPAELQPHTAMCLVPAVEVRSRFGQTLMYLGAEDGGQRVVVESDADEVRWIVRDGIIVKKVKGGSSVLTMEEFRDLPSVPRDAVGSRRAAIYVRAELLGHGAAAWTQPFWIEG